MRIGDIQTEQDINTYLRSCRRIRFTQVDTEGMSLYDMFRKFISESPETCYLRGKRQCYARRSRSLYDFSRLARYYKPDVTVKDLLDVVFEYFFGANAEQNRLGIAYCGTVRRYNFRMSYWWNRRVDSSTFSDQRVNRIKSDIVLMFARDYPNLNKEQFTLLVENYFGGFRAQQQQVS